MRKLASIRRITDVIKHPNADALDIVKIDGWQVVTQKDLYKPNDLAIYFEIDSFLPVIPQFEFLRKCCFKSNPDGFRIKTIKLRGELSSGLLMPIKDLFEIIDISGKQYINIGSYNKHTRSINDNYLQNT